MSAHAAFWTSRELLVLMITGPATLAPLLLFHTAARYLPYSTMDFLQYIVPTLIILQAVFLFDESFNKQNLLTFTLI